jgi:type II secretory pathway predicted ATPase ExeA
MYEEFFGLTRRLFSATPDASCFVPLEGPQAALDALAIGCERGQGIGVLTGDAGLGKTLLGLRLAFELQPTFQTAFVNHSAFPTRRALLQAILFELHRPYIRLAEQELRLELASALKALRAEHQALVVILDEAHKLSEPLLDEVRLLAMLADRGEPLTRVVLIGDRDLEERLTDPGLSAFNQRVCCQVELTPLTQAESIEYLRACVELAGGHVDEIFSDDALLLIAKAADGSPRCLNHLSDHSLLLAYVGECRPVTADIARQALDDLKQLPLNWHDPIFGGKIYRGLSQQVATEAELEPVTTEPIPSREPETADQETLYSSRPMFSAESWEAPDFGRASAAIEIGENTEHISCRQDDWQEQTARPLQVDDLLANVAELAKSADWPEGQSDDDERDSAGNSGENVTPQHAMPLVQNRPAEPVWNLPARTWESADNGVFEEEPVIDRYLRIESGASTAGVAWNVDTLHPRPDAKPGPSVITKQEATSPSHTHETPGLNARFDAESKIELTVGGVVETISRSPRADRLVPQVSVNRDDFPPHEESESEPQTLSTDHTFEALASSRSESAGSGESCDVPPPLPSRERHLPSELLQATLEEVGLEEQIGAEVLDLYLNTQTASLDRTPASGRPSISLERPLDDASHSGHEWNDLREDIHPVDIVQPESDQSAQAEFDGESLDVPERRNKVEGHHETEDSRWRNPPPVGDASARAAQPDPIQRAYRRLFSELRRRHHR